MTERGLVGTSVLRREDGRFLDGSARYVPDIRLDGMLEVVVKRSSIAHGRINAIEIRRALELPGVVAVILGEDLTDIGVYRPYHLSPSEFVELVNPLEKLHDVPLLATDRVRRVGEPVALVVATDRYIAEDAAHLIDIDYEELPAVLDPEKALQPDAPVIHDELGDNVQSRVSVSCGDVEGAFENAEHAMELQFTIPRQIGSPLETRGVVANYEQEGDGLVIWSATQMPHLSRKVVGGILGLPPEGIRVICPDMGGSFGGGVYYEDILIPYLARRLGKPVRWLEDRSENLANARHARGQTHSVDVAFNSDGRILALRDRIIVDMGMANFYGLVVPYNTVTHLRSQYRIDNFSAELTTVITNKTPSAPVRGAGRVTAAFVMERIIDRVARELGLDSAEVRFANLIPAESMPYQMGIPYRDGLPIIYDSGDYPEQLRLALEAVDYPKFRAAQAEDRESDRCRGIGIAAYVEGSGYGPHEGATVRVDEQGRVTILSGSNSHGQSHETTLAQVCADTLGVTMDRIAFRDGDTSLIQHGGGTFASRSAVTGGMAVAGASTMVSAKVKAIAGGIHRVDPSSLNIEDGLVVDESGESLMTLGEVAAAARPGSGIALPDGVGHGLEATYYFVPPTVTWSSGTHVAIVEVDPTTGHVAVEKYVVVHDCGQMINPAVVEGQVTGGVVHGIGNALFEEAIFDDSGRLMTNDFLSYHIPRAPDSPNVEVIHQEFHSPLNSLGIKGCGEGGTVAAPPAIINAIEDALLPIDLQITEMPVRPETLLRLITDARNQEVETSDQRHTG